MYYLTKELSFDAAHALTHLNYQSKCKNLHGHTWVVKVYLKSEELNENDMVMDFNQIKDIVRALDHSNLNSALTFPPTAENIAKWLCERIGPLCYKVELWETPSGMAAYERSGI